MRNRISKYPAKPFVLNKIQCLRDTLSNQNLEIENLILSLEECCYVPIVCGEPRQQCQNILVSHDTVNIGVNPAYTYGEWIDQADPLGGDDDDVPYIYRRRITTQNQDGVVWWNGSFVVYKAIETTRNVLPFTGATALYQAYVSDQRSVWVNQPYASGIQTDKQFQTTDDPYTTPWPKNDFVCVQLGTTNTYTPPILPNIAPVFTGSKTWSCEADTATENGRVWDRKFDVPPEEPECPGPWGNVYQMLPGLPAVQYSDYEATEPDNITTFSNRITKQELIDESLLLIGEFPEYEEMEAVCYTELTATWPTQGEVRTDHSGWPECGTFPSYTGTVGIVVARIRFGVPIDHPNLVWQQAWDFAFASHAWWVWYDGGMVGPSPDGEVEIIMSSHEWIWSGNLENQWSDFYVIPVNNAEGQVRVHNMVITCE